MGKAKAFAAAAIAAATLSAEPVPLKAQAPFVAPEFYARTRPDFGNTLPLCVIPNSATLERDREIARQLAEMLLLEPRVVEMDVDFALLDVEGIWPAIVVHLAEKCVGVLGVQILPGEAIPDWTTLSRPYFEAPYILLVTDPAIGSVADLPAGTRLGVPLFTPIDNEVMTVIAAGGQFAQLRRLPYDRPELMAALMRSGELDAAIVWEPHLSRPALQPPDFFTARASVSPLRETTRSIAILLRTQDEMLRTMIDEAIGVLEGGRD